MNFDNPNSFMALLNSLRGPLKAPDFQVTLWQQNIYIFGNLKVIGVQWLT